MVKNPSLILAVIVVLVGIAMVITPWIFHYTGYHLEADIVFGLGALVVALGGAILGRTMQAMPPQRPSH
jgi:hypothetical protein